MAHSLASLAPSQPLTLGGRFSPLSVQHCTKALTGAHLTASLQGLAISSILHSSSREVHSSCSSFPGPGSLAAGRDAAEPCSNAADTAPQLPGWAQRVQGSLKPTEQLPPGLYIVATPIGNLEDITLRALRVLRDADLILAEDTRHTRKLLSYFGLVQRPLQSCHAHNEHERQAQARSSVSIDDHFCNGKLPLTLHVFPGRSSGVGQVERGGGDSTGERRWSAGSE